MQQNLAKSPLSVGLYMCTGMMIHAQCAICTTFQCDDASHCSVMMNCIAVWWCITDKLGQAAYEAFSMEFDRRRRTTMIKRKGWQCETSIWVMHLWFGNVVVRGSASDQIVRQTHCSDRLALGLPCYWLVWFGLIQKEEQRLYPPQIIWVCPDIWFFFQFHITDICQTSESFSKSVNLNEERAVKQSRTVPKVCRRIRTHIANKQILPYWKFYFGS